MVNHPSVSTSGWVVHHADPWTPLTRRVGRSQPTIAAAGSKPKRIEEFVGRVNTRTDQLSIAHMQSPSGWEEPGQTPEFDEFTLVLAGLL
jgi:hypothetical protein